MLEFELQTCFTTFDERLDTHPLVKKYSRKQRFMRLFHNLRGLQNIKHNIMRQIPPQIKLVNLRGFLKKNRFLRRHCAKIPSIWRQLGHEMPDISEKDMEKACYCFCKIREKKSFLILLPFICIQIGRRDLLKFIKQPSKNIQKKYSIVIK